MSAVEFETVDDLRPYIGKELYVSDWLTVTQERINLFAEATGDFQWIHVDVERAKSDSPFGGTIAHGFLTLSLLAKFASEGLVIRRKKAAVNYGLNKVRFITPVLAGARIRGRGALAALEPIPGGAQVIWDGTVELEGADRPVCTAQSVARYFY
jgi:acyl dehydratase